MIYIYTYIYMLLWYYITRYFGAKALLALAQSLPWTRWGGIMLGVKVLNLVKLETA
jgi:hypothetical protein